MVVLDFDISSTSSTLLLSLCVESKFVDRDKFVYLFPVVFGITFDTGNVGCVMYHESFLFQSMVCLKTESEFQSDPGFYLILNIPWVNSYQL